MSYAELNELTHEIARRVEQATGRGLLDPDSLYRLNDELTALLLSRGVTFFEEGDQIERGQLPRASQEHGQRRALSTSRPPNRMSSARARLPTRSSKAAHSVRIKQRL